jgi:hypothetical protein
MKEKDKVVMDAMALLIKAGTYFRPNKTNAKAALKVVDREGKYRDEWPKMAEWIANEFNG